MSSAARHLPLLAALAVAQIAGLAPEGEILAEPLELATDSPLARVPTEDPPTEAAFVDEPTSEELPALERAPGWLGVVLQDGFAPLGVLIVDVWPGSPAAHAGLRPGDLIRRLDDAVPRDAIDIAKLVHQRQAGDAITLAIDRAGTIVEITATLATAAVEHAGRADTATHLPSGPHAPAATRGHVRVTAPRAWLGVETAPVTNLARRIFRLPNNQGAVVNYVYADSPAGRAGIRPGAVVRAIDSRQVTNPRDVARFIFEAGVGRQVEIALWADDGPVWLYVRLDVHPLDAMPPDATAVLPSSVRDDATTTPSE